MGSEKLRGNCAIVAVSCQIFTTCATFAAVMEKRECEDALRG